MSAPSLLEDTFAPLIPVEQAQIEYGVSDRVMEALLDVGSLALGRPVYSEYRGGVRFCSRPDMQRATAPMRVRVRRGRVQAFEKNTIKNAKGAWHTYRWFMDSLGVSRGALGPWALKKKIRRRPTYVYAREHWHKVWVYHEGSVRKVLAKRERLKKAAARGRGPGATFEEARAMGFPTPNILYAWSDPDGEGIRELNGVKLEKWKEPRIDASGHVQDRRVFSRKRLRQVLTARASKAAAQEQDTAEYSARLPKRASCRHPVTGELFLSLERFCKLTGWDERTVYHYCDERHKHPSIRARINTLEQGGQTFYSQKHGRQIGAWRRAWVKRKDTLRKENAKTCRRILGRSVLTTEDLQEQLGKAGIGETYQKRAARDARVQRVRQGRNGPWCCYLPNRRKPPTQIELAELAELAHRNHHPTDSNGDAAAAQSKETMPPTTRPPEPPSAPRWDGEQRTLWLGDQKLKAFDKHPSTNQIDLIEAFDNQGWPPGIVDPFKNQERLRQTWRDLNRTLPPNTIRFGGDGTGEGVCWRRVPEPN